MNKKVRSRQFSSVASVGLYGVLRCRPLWYPRRRRRGRHAAGFSSRFFAVPGGSLCEYFKVTLKGAGCMAFPRFCSRGIVFGYVARGGRGLRGRRRAGGCFFSFVSGRVGPGPFPRAPGWAPFSGFQIPQMAGNSKKFRRGPFAAPAAAVFRAFLVVSLPFRFAAPSRGFRGGGGAASKNI